MKKVLSLLIIMFSVMSCKKETTQPGPQITPSAPKEAEVVEPAGDQCYTWNSNGSVI